MPDLSELTPSAVDISAEQLVEAEIFDDALSLGEAVRCVIPSQSLRHATDPMAWMPWNDLSGVFFPKKGDRAVVAYQEEGAPIITFWAPTATEPDEPVAVPDIPPHDYGIVEALPGGTIAKGSRATFKAATGIYWELRYTAEATYPWAKIGGPPLQTQYTAAANLTTESETPQTTNAPSITMPAVKMEATFDWGANLAYAVVAGGQARLSLYVAGSSTGNDAYSSEGFATGGTIAALRAVSTRTVAASVAVQVRYWRFAASGAVQFFAPYLAVDPVRLG